ncbi:MAG: hypothetical protein M3R55_15545, partial [Acidobacteriota bacterium]|nr:hypothetical protein [Acidobacteriota bacterium]
MTARATTLAAAAAALLLLGLPLGFLSGPAVAQEGAAPDPRFAGLEWTFARVRYGSQAGGSGRRGRGEFDNP